MVVRDGKGKVVALWRGDTLKLYDGHFIQANKWQFDEQFEGATILGSTLYLR
jgi:hypothetical protein